VNFTQAVYRVNSHCKQLLFPQTTNSLGLSMSSSVEGRTCTHELRDRFLREVLKEFSSQPRRWTC